MFVKICWGIFGWRIFFKQGISARKLTFLYGFYKPGFCVNFLFKQCVPRYMDNPYPYSHYSFGHPVYYNYRFITIYMEQISWKKVASGQLWGGAGDASILGTFLCFRSVRLVRMIYGISFRTQYDIIKLISVEYSTSKISWILLPTCNSSPRSCNRFLKYRSAYKTVPRC